MKWHSKRYQDVMDELGSGPNGLSERAAEERQETYGPNKLQDKPQANIIVKFFMQFNDFMILILLIAAGVSGAMAYLNGENDFLDPIIIMAIVVVNAILGLIQENKAEKSIEALKQMAMPLAKVIRDGKQVLIDSEALVPGDLLVLETGDYVAADARLISCQYLQAEESALTGESVPVEKDESLLCAEDTAMGDKRNMVFAGSAVTYGRGRAIVTDTGMQTQMGKIAGMIIAHDAPETPLQRKLGETGKMLGLGALCICFVIFLLGLMRHIPSLQMFMTSISLAVAAIPEGLPAIVTIVLAIGVQRMAKYNAIVRRLPAVETLGSANVICSDKTGTLTQNKMKVVEVWDAANALTAKSEAKKWILELSAMCNNSRIGGDAANTFGDPTETALVAAASAHGIDIHKLDMETPRIDELPFDSLRKLMSTVHKNGGRGSIVVTKGAVDMLIHKCSHYDSGGKVIFLSNEKKREIIENNIKMADKALRVLAVAYKETVERPTRKEIEKDLIFAGLIGMIDPPRAEVPDAVAMCKTAGIKAVMITGDHVVTAMAIAKKIGIMGSYDKAITGDALAKMSQEELCENINSYRVFARVSPEHKVRIVQAFQQNGNVVAMTGDGVNDAPALKAADIGCAMGKNGTDVAKGAADMVLTDDNFATIVEAVRQGRGIYANIKKAVHFLLSSNIGEIITIFVALFMGWDTPLLPIHLLWVNLVTDSLPAIALGVDPPEQDVMERKPMDTHKGLFAGGLWQQIGTEGVMIGLLALIAYGIGIVMFDAPGSHQIGRTMCFATLSISQLFHAFNMRSEKSIFKINILENKYLVAALAAGLLMQSAVISITPLAKIFKVVGLLPSQWLTVVLLSVAPILVVELQKQWAAKLGERYMLGKA